MGHFKEIELVFINICLFRIGSKTGRTLFFVLKKPCGVTPPPLIRGLGVFVFCFGKWCLKGGACRSFG